MTTGRFAVLVLVGALAGTALAQDTQPAATNTNGGYQATAYPEQYNYYNLFYPAPEVRALPNLRAAAVATKAQWRRAESDLNNSIEDIRRQFKHSAELKEALADERDAYEDLKRVQLSATAHLKNDPSYTAAIELRKRLADQIEQYRGKSGTTFEDMLAMATVKLSYSATATAMEAAALAAEPEVASARKRLVGAAARVAELRQQFDEAVRNSPEVMLARKTVADARVAALAADAAYIEAANVANVAFDYAYYLRNNPYPYVNNYPYYNYYGGYGYGGFGYGGGYRAGYPYNWNRPVAQPHAQPRPR
jgi:hypothetical protein